MSSLKLADINLTLISTPSASILHLLSLHQFKPNHIHVILPPFNNNFKQASVFEKEAEEALRKETLRQITLNEVKQQNLAVRELLLGINSYVEEQEGSLLEEEMNRRFLLETTVLQKQLLPARYNVTLSCR